MSEKTQQHLLALHALLLNRYGPDSPEVKRFMEVRRDHKEFYELMQLARTLKKALTESTP